MTYTYVLLAVAAAHVVAFLALLPSTFPKGDLS